MLSRLIIRNYALIEDLDISFSHKLNILTGETGAGKSIILGALSLLLGQRAESRYFYNQQKKCVIEGIFAVSGYNLSSFFVEKDLDYEDETVLRREISADGKSRAFINDTPVNLTVLRELGELLIDIHSQHATLEINDEKFQLLVVDSLAANATLLTAYQENYLAYRKDTARLKELEEESRQAKADLDYYQYQFNELEQASLINDEQEILEQELTALSHAEEIKRNLIAATYLLNNNDQAAVVQLKESLSQLQHIERFFPSVKELSQRLESTIIEIKDIAAEIETLEQKTQINEERSAEINERLAIIYNLQKKHRVTTIQELTDIKARLSDKLYSISFADDEIEKLKAGCSKLKAELIGLSDTLSASRNEVIPSIEDRIKEMLTEVGMPHAVLKIENILLDEDQLNYTGRNKIQFLFSANKGQEPAPVNKVASGGELSRLMLSIKSLISRHTALPTIIFDEIDTGISGEVALKVGRILEKLADGMQVIAITHLPQIASKGDAHYFVYKDERQDRTHTNISLLGKEERVTEIAKMLSGENPGEFALQHARELLETGY
ncbi:DNA replication and repair protein RecN [Arcticibacter tournemirensis]|uniref:DNA repair protein RecN n=1 Tax=Arcticibacter tournemirensis TaxID=699437 RepID=A0A5M9H575_9SPHI|nr:DNA repair protein RecN [Arcticibacter tournemirensis]KAA8482092.1 DNA repair protein RecN [Arcticibacter tournemirensis]TQM49504.1 DNA replication and repair protein RecN [Arcticibacter tournemirensis]